MMAQRKGLVVMVGSVSSHLSSPFAGIYSASKVCARGGCCTCFLVDSFVPRPSMPCLALGVCLAHARKPGQQEGQINAEALQAICAFFACSPGSIAHAGRHAAAGGGTLGRGSDLRYGRRYQVKV